MFDASVCVRSPSAHFSRPLSHPVPLSKDLLPSRRAGQQNGRTPAPPSPSSICLRSSTMHRAVSRGGGVLSRARISTDTIEGWCVCVLGSKSNVFENIHPSLPMSLSLFAALICCLRTASSQQQQHHSAEEHQLEEKGFHSRAGASGSHVAGGWCRTGTVPVRYDAPLKFSFFSCFFPSKEANE